MSQPIAVTSVPVDVTHRGVPSWTRSPSLQHRHLLHILLYSPLSNTDATPLQSTTMTDLTPTLNTILTTKHALSIPAPATCTPSTEVADEFLKEAHRIVSPSHTPTNLTQPSNQLQHPQNSHITSLLKYLHSIRHAYLTTTAHPRRQTKDTFTPHTHTTSTSTLQTHLTDPERDAIDSSTALLLRDLATSINNLSSAETLRQETSSSLLRKKYGHSAAGALLWRWAGGGSALDNTSAGQDGKSAEQAEAEERAKTIAGVREGVLWFLRRRLDGVAGVQREMVEKRIERVREREKSVLYKSAGAAGKGKGKGKGVEVSAGGGGLASSSSSFSAPEAAPDATVLSEAETARIEAQLSPEQLQLFAEENDSMLRHYEDTLGKVQYVCPRFFFFCTTCF